MASSSSSSSAAADAEPYVVEDCRGALQVLSDGTVVRPATLPFPVGAGYDDGGAVEWKDAVYDAARGLGVRMYKPRKTTAEGEKLPVVVYFHGGGFCLGSYAWPNFHSGCLRLAAELPAVVLSFDYRLAPEHRLPAAHEDAVTALLWLKDQLLGEESDPWLAGTADARKVFVSGESAGGNIAHHLALRFGTAGLHPVKIAGYILLMPAFLSEKATQSELDTPESAFLNRDTAERYCRLMLPAGATKDHPMVNPLAPDSPSLEAMDVGRALVVAAEGDLLRDSNVEYAERLKQAHGAAAVQLVVFAGEEHAFFGVKPLSDATGELVRLIGRFIAAAGHTVISCPQ